MAQNTRTVRRGTHSVAANTTDSRGAQLLARAERLWREKEGKGDEDIMVRDWQREDVILLLDSGNSDAAIAAARKALEEEKKAGAENGPTLRSSYHDLLVSQMALKCWNLLLIRRKRAWSEAYAAGTPKGTQEEYRAMQARIGEVQSVMVLTYQAAGRVSQGLEAENKIMSQGFSAPIEDFLAD